MTDAMTMPKAARDLIEAADQNDYQVSTEVNFTTVHYTYDDESVQDFEGCPVLFVQVTTEDVGCVAGWVKNPVSGRWTTNGQKPSIFRVRRDWDNEAERRLNEIMGHDTQEFEAPSMRFLIRLVSSPNFAHKVRRW